MDALFMVRDFGRGFAMRNDELIRAVENDDLLSCELVTAQITLLPPPPASKTSNCPPPPSSQVPKTPPPPPTFVKSPPPPVVKSALLPPPPPPVVKPPPTPIVNPPPPNGPPPPCVTYPPPPPKQQTCPIDALKLGACVGVLGGLIHIGLSDSAKEKCCPLLQGLADLDAAICLCTAIRLEALNLINLLVPISLQVLVNDCRKYPPAGFQCPA